MHLLYAIASYLALFLLGLPVLLTHPKLRHGIAQRLGFYRARRGPREGRPRIWLHGASAGDLLSLQPMMKELKARVPGLLHRRHHHHQQRPGDGAEQARRGRRGGLRALRPPRRHRAGPWPRCAPTCWCSSTPRSGPT